MSDAPLSSEAPAAGPAVIGATTRTIAWVIDAVIINVAAIIAGLGVALVVAIFPFPKGHHTIFNLLAGVAYVFWFGGYFVVFWVTSGQTPGARAMQIGLVSRRGGRVAPARAVVRWVGMNAAAFALFVGYVPLLLGRRAFPDWLARTDVVDRPQTSAGPSGGVGADRAAGEHPGLSPLPGDSRPPPERQAGLPPTRRHTYGQRI